MKISFLVFFLVTTFYAQANTCPEGMYSVQGHPRSAYYRNDGSHVSSTTVSSYCRHYRDDGPVKEEFPYKIPKGWPYKKEDFKKCTKEKQAKISKILLSIPKILTNVGKLQIYCPSKSDTPNNPATSSPDAKIIALYDLSFKMDTKRVIIHELAHLLWTRLSDIEKGAYQKASGWSSYLGTYIINRTKFSEEDGKHGPEEDFANNIEHYFSDQNKFKINFPQIYNWIHSFTRKEK